MGGGRVGGRGEKGREERGKELTEDETGSLTISTKTTSLLASLFGGSLWI